MCCVHSWLVKNKKFHGDARDFKRKVNDIWFGLYRRETHNDSSGFEHVFVGEEKNVWLGCCCQPPLSLGRLTGSRDLCGCTCAGQDLRLPQLDPGVQ